MAGLRTFRTLTSSQQSGIKSKHMCAECLEICESHPPGTLRACPGL